MSTIQEFDQVVEGNIDIKQLSKNKYQITFSQIRKFLLYQVWSDSSQQLNDNRSVYYLKAKEWVLSKFPTSKTNPESIPFEPTTVLAINNKRRYVFVIKKATVKKDGRIVFDVSTDEIKLHSNISKKILRLPEGCFKNARFDIDFTICPCRCSVERPGCNISSGCCNCPNRPQFCPPLPPPPPPPPPPSQPQLRNFNISTQSYPGYPIVVQITQPNSNSSGAFNYSSSNSNIATISAGSTVKFLTIGTVIITATQAASGNYSQGSIQITVTVQLQAGTTSFEGANFVGATLSNLDLSKFNFENSNFTNANLTNANLTSAILTNANFTNANLINANLTSANLTIANFTNANLISANLTSANLTTATLTSANLTSANLTNATLNGANLTSANFTNANLHQVSMNYSNLTNANLNGANLLGIASYWSSKQSPVNLDKAVAIGNNGINFTNGWSFIQIGYEEWILSNSNIPY